MYECLNFCKYEINRDFVRLFQLPLNKPQRQPVWLKHFVSQTLGYNGPRQFLIHLTLYCFFFQKHFQRQNEVYSLVREEFVTYKVLPYYKGRKLRRPFKEGVNFKRLWRLT